MGLVVNTNVSAINTSRILRRSTLDLNKSLERLSSGLRINRAADDAAGLAIAEGLRSQVRGWCLTRPPSQIPAIDAVEALGRAGPRPAECRGEWTTCEHPHDCALVPFCRRAHESLEATFKDVTLSDLGRPKR